MHTVLLDARHEHYGSSDVIGLYELQTQEIYEFDTLTKDGRLRRLYSVGRGRYCDIQLSDPTVSTLHCHILRQEDGSFLIRDTESTNGILVNHIQVESAPLAPGMWVFIGQTELVVLGHERKVPITASTNSSFLANAARIYGSDRKAGEAVNKSHTTIRRARKSKEEEEEAREEGEQSGCQIQSILWDHEPRHDL